MYRIYYNSMVVLLLIILIITGIVINWGISFRVNFVKMSNCLKQMDEAVMNGDCATLNNLVDSSFISCLELEIKKVNIQINKSSTTGQVPYSIPNSICSASIFFIEQMFYNYAYFWTFSIDEAKKDQIVVHLQCPTENSGTITYDLFFEEDEEGLKLVCIEDFNDFLYRNIPN